MSNSRSPYQRLSDNGNNRQQHQQQRRTPQGGASSPREASTIEHHRQRRVEDYDDPQAPWLTHLEYSVDPLLWEDDLKYKSCPLCNSPFVASLMGSGRHHCRMCGCLCCGSCSRGSLDLPGYEDGEERVCEPCRKKVLSLRTFLQKNQETLINNVHVNRDAIKFDCYHQGNPPYLTEIWLSQSLLLLMYKLSDGAMDGVPVNLIQEIRTGIATKEFEKRKQKTVLCCVSSIDEEFASKDPFLFSIVLTDGRTLDFESPTPQLRNEWVERLKSLVANTASFVQYHFDVAQYKVHELVAKEKERLSPANIKKLIDQKKSVERAGRNVNSNAIRKKYAAKKG